MTAPETLATDLLDQARSCIEAARVHLDEAGPPTSELAASNMAAGFRAYWDTALALGQVRLRFEVFPPDGAWDFGDGRVQRLPFGLPVWTTKAPRRFERVGEFDGLRPQRWLEQDEAEERA